MTAEKRLGRGLGSLLGEASTPTTGQASAAHSPGPALDRPAVQDSVPLRLIRPNPHQPRKTFDDEGLRELSESIRAHGVLQPVVVRPVGSHFELVSGERRCRAARMAGLETMPVTIRNVPDREMLELALVENVQRRDLDPIERAAGFRELQETLDLTQEEVAAKVGLKRTTVTNHIRLLDLPDQAQDALKQGLLSMGHARALLGLRRSSDLLDLLEETIRNDLSVRQVEASVKAKANPKPPPAPGPNLTDARPAWVVDAERRMREHLGTRVRIDNGIGYQGRIVIEYQGKDTLDGLLQKLGPRPML